MRAWVLVALVACRGPRAEVRPDPARSVTAAPSPTPPVVVVVNRVHGDIDGRFTGPSVAFVGEPIVVEMNVRPKSGPLTFFNGGDMRNVANYPLHFAVKAMDASGAVACDVVATPPFPSFGGPGSDMTVKLGDGYRERVVINPACPALSKPGSYRVTIHRRFITSSTVIRKPGAAYPISCDIAPVHETLPTWIDPGCAKLLEGAPSITTELPIEIKPFDAMKVRTATEKTLRDITGDEIVHYRIERHICSFVSCACPKSPTDADLVAAIPLVLPKSFPAPCP